MADKPTAADIALSAAQELVSSLTETGLAQAAEITALKARLETHEASEADRIVTEYRAKKGLAGDHTSLVAQYRSAPEMWTSLMDAIPDSQLSQRVTGTPEQAPSEVDISTPQRLHAHIQSLGLSTEASADAWSRLSNQQAAKARSRHQEV